MISAFILLHTLNMAQVVAPQIPCFRYSCETYFYNVGIVGKSILNLSANQPNFPVHFMSSQQAPLQVQCLNWVWRRFLKTHWNSKSATIMRCEIITAATLWKSEISSIHNLIFNMEKYNFYTRLVLGYRSLIFLEGVHKFVNYLILPL